MRIGYSRVSTRDQRPESQHDALTAAGWDEILLDKAGGALRVFPQPLGEPFANLAGLLLSFERHLQVRAVISSDHRAVRRPQTTAARRSASCRARSGGTRARGACPAPVGSVTGARSRPREGLDGADS